MSCQASTPRGIRNKNPLNLRKSANKWLGKVENGADPEFEEFLSMELGIRAAFVNARNLMRRTKNPTLVKLISIWAPPSENATEAYVKFVCQTCHLVRNERINFNNKKTMCEIFSAMIIVENGQSLPMEVIMKAYELV